MSEACEGCHEVAPRLPVRVFGRALALCCDCRRLVERKDRTPLVKIKRVEVLTITRHVSMFDEPGPYDVYAQLRRRGIK